MPIRSYDPSNFRGKRLPVCLCLDTSGSMTGAPIDSLNEGLGVFWEAMKEDSEASEAADVAIITFGYGGIECPVDFGNIAGTKPPLLLPGGMTPLGEAVELAADTIDARLRAYREVGCEYYSPWLLLTTDGMPNGNPACFRKAAARITTMARHERLSVFPVAVGEDADIEALQKFSPHRKAMKLKDLAFEEMFRWLAENIMRAVRSARTLTSPEAWGELA